MALGMFRVNSCHFKGILIGILLSIAPVNFYVFFPLIILALLIFSNGYFPNPKVHKSFIYLLYFLCVFIFLICTYRFLNGFAINIKLILIPFIFLILIYVKFTEDFLIGFLYVILILFWVNLYFNLNTMLTGSDLLGRIVDYRPTDFTYRWGGVYGHAFLNNSVNVLGFLTGYYLKDKWVKILSIISLSYSGAGRDIISAILVILCCILVKCKISKSVKLLIGFIFIALIFFGVQLSEGTNTSNGYRYFAWQNATSEIKNNFLIGKEYNSDIDDFSVINLTPYQIRESIVYNGDAESNFLEFTLKFGIPASFFLIVFIFTLTRPPKFLITHFDRFREVVSLIAFFDFFYGSLLSTVIFSIYFGLVVLSVGFK